MHCLEHGLMLKKCMTAPVALEDGTLPIGMALAWPWLAGSEMNGFLYITLCSGQHHDSGCPREPQREFLGAVGELASAMASTGLTRPTWAALIQAQIF